MFYLSGYAFSSATAGKYCSLLTLYHRASVHAFEFGTFAKHRADSYIRRELASGYLGLYQCMDGRLLEPDMEMLLDEIARFRLKMTDKEKDEARHFISRYLQDYASEI